jgi:hypothetical protein
MSCPSITDRGEKAGRLAVVDGRDDRVVQRELGREGRHDGLGEYLGTKYVAAEW